MTLTEQQLNCKHEWVREYDIDECEEECPLCGITKYGWELYLQGVNDGMTANYQDQYDKGYLQGVNKTDAEWLSRIDSPELLETLSDLEHEQWMKWSKHVFKTLTEGTLSIPEIGKRVMEKGEMWRPNWKPYSELPDGVKEFDREWARKIVEKLKEVTVK